MKNLPQRRRLSTTCLRDGPGRLEPCSAASLRLRWGISHSVIKGGGVKGTARNFNVESDRISRKRGLVTEAPSLVQEHLDQSFYKRKKTQGKVSFVGVK